MPNIKADTVLSGTIRYEEPFEAYPNLIPFSLEYDDRVFVLIKDETPVLLVMAGIVYQLVEAEQ